MIAALFWLGLLGVAYWWGRKDRPSRQETTIGLHPQPVEGDAFPRCLP